MNSEFGDVLEDVIIVDTDDTPKGFRKLRRCCCATNVPHIAFRVVAWIFWTFFLLIGIGAAAAGLVFYYDDDYDPESNMFGSCPIENDDYALTWTTDTLTWFMATSGIVHLFMAIPKMVDLGMMNRRCWKHHPDCILGYRVVLNTWLCVTSLGLLAWLGVGIYFSYYVWLERDKYGDSYSKAVCSDIFFYTTTVYIALMLFFYVVAIFVGIFYCFYSWYMRGRAKTLSYSMRG